jgi:RNA polymerase sigma factor (sigma-70 family)
MDTQTLTAVIASAPPPSTIPCLMGQICNYLALREQGLPCSPNQEVAWASFYDRYSRRIRSFALKSGINDEDVADCVQDVWRELLVRLPRFELDLSIGAFDTWLFAVVQSKASNLRRRSRRHRLHEAGKANLRTVHARECKPDLSVEQQELVAMAWQELRKRVSKRNYQVLRCRLLEARSVSEVARDLGLSPGQVYCRFCRARRVLAEISEALARRHCACDQERCRVV